MSHGDLLESFEKGGTRNDSGFLRDFITKMSRRGTIRRGIIK